MTATVRAQLADALENLLPDNKYRIVANVGTIDRLAKPLIQIELAAFQPSTGARGARMVEVTLHVATHLTGVTPAAEDAADAAGLEVFEALEALTWANPTRAEKTIYKDQYLGYDITTEILTKRSTQ